LEIFEKEEWLLFRTKLFNFQDFTTEWTEKLQKSTSRDPITSYIRQQLDRFKVIYPTLKICIGEPFEQDHWRDLFHMLDVPKDIRLEKLLFSHLLDAEDLLIKKGNEIKELQARAIVITSLQQQKNIFITNLLGAH
jgi:dynein heavy chain 2, cytosolic